MKRSLVLAVVVLVVLAGCGGAQSGSDVADSGDAEATVPESASDGAGGSGGSGDGGSADVEDGADSESFNARAKTQARYRIKTATIQMQVDSYENTRTTLVSETRSLGGYVDSESSDRHTRGNQSWKSGTLILRVPTEDYDTLLATIESSGTIEHKETKTKDVTERVVDLKARLKNLKAQRDRLRTLYDEANETDEILRVGERLSEVQGDIERVEGQLQVLENRVAYSTVRVHIEEEPPKPDDPPEQDAWYETGAFTAFLESIQGVIVLGRMLVVGFAYAAPYVLALGLPVVGVIGAVRRFS